MFLSTFIMASLPQRKIIDFDTGTNNNNITRKQYGLYIYIYLEIVGKLLLQYNFIKRFYLIEVLSRNCSKDGMDL